MADRYWVGGAGTWDGSSTTHWAATSGGSSGASVPTAADDVYLDGNSGVTGANQIVTTNAVCLGRSLDCTGFTGTLRLANGTQAIVIGDASGGMMKLVTGMTLSPQGNSVIRFVSTSTNGGVGWPITCAGRTMCGISLNGSGGKWTLQDDFNSPSGIGQVIQVVQGHFDSNNKNITCSQFQSTGSLTREITLGTSVISLYFTGAVAGWNIVSTGLALHAENCEIIYTASVPSNARLFSAAGFDYGTFTAIASSSAGSIEITANCSFAKINFVNPSGTKTLLITANKTVTIRDPKGLNGVKGSASGVTTLKSATASSPATIQFDSLVPSVCRKLSVQDITVTPAGHLCVLQSTLVSGNSGISTEPESWEFSE